MGTELKTKLINHEIVTPENWLEKLSKRTKTLCEKADERIEDFKLLSFLGTWSGIMSYDAFNSGNITPGLVALGSTLAVALILAAEVKILSI